MNRRDFFASLGALAAAWLVPRWFKATPTPVEVYSLDYDPFHFEPSEWALIDSVDGFEVDWAARTIDVPIA